MTVMIEPERTLMTPKDLRREMAEVRYLAANARDPAELDEALDAVTRLSVLGEELRALVAEVAPDLVVQALRAGLDPASLERRPYSAPQVRKVARQAGIPPARRGRRPVRRQTDD